MSMPAHTVEERLTRLEAWQQAQARTDIRAEMLEHFSTVRSDIKSLHDSITTVHTGLRTDINTVRADLRSDINTVHTALRADIQDNRRATDRLFYFILITMTSATGGALLLLANRFLPAG